MVPHGQRRRQGAKIVKIVVGGVGLFVVLYLIVIAFFPTVFDKLNQREEMRRVKHVRDIATSLGEVRLDMLMSFDEIQSALRAPPTSIHRGGTIVNGIRAEWYDGLVTAEFVASGNDFDPRHAANAGRPIQLSLKAPLKGSIDRVPIGVPCLEALRKSPRSDLGNRLDCNVYGAVGITVTDDSWMLK